MSGSVVSVCTYGCANGKWNRSPNEAKTTICNYGILKYTNWKSRNPVQGGKTAVFATLLYGGGGVCLISSKCTLRQREKSKKQKKFVSLFPLRSTSCISYSRAFFLFDVPIAHLFIENSIQFLSPYRGCIALFVVSFDLFTTTLCAYALNASPLQPYIDCLY